MKKIVLDPTQLSLMSKFSSLTKVVPKDVFEINETLVFIVPTGDVGRAVGKKAGNVVKLKKFLKRENIKIIEYNGDMTQFIKNVIHPNKPDEIIQNGETIILKTSNLQTRGYLIGKNASTLRFSEAVVKRYFNIKDIRVQQIEV